MAIDEILFSFDGRMKRSTFCVFWAITQPAAALVSFLLLMAAVSGSTERYSLLALSFALTVFLYGLWAGLAIYAKRWHDLGRSGWMTLTLLVPFIDVLVLAFLLLAPGTAGTNRYGRAPGN